MRRLRPVIILLMALWLPLQALVAVAMPFCQDMPGPSHTAPSHQHHGEHYGEPSDPSDGDHAFTLQCNNCGPCHLACAPMVGGTTSIAVASVSQHLCAQPQAVPPARTLDQPHPPPLA